jgi:3-oxoacyl-(acyl-carrier-protein) synthase
MSLCIVGTGMVSPAGLTPRAHACVLWAGALPPTPSPFLGDGDEAVRVSYCPWLGARLDMPSRLLAMAQRALEDALRSLRALHTDMAAPLLVCSTPERPPLSSADHERIVQGLAGMTGARGATSLRGAAGVFAALGEAEVLLAEGAGAVAIVGLDSYVGEDALAAHMENPPNPWGAAPASPAEGAAALVVASAHEAHRLGIEALGAVRYVGTTSGLSNDDNDLPTDGEAMTSLLRRLPPLRAPWVFGPSNADALRQAEWQMAVARSPARFHPEYESRSRRSSVWWAPQRAR